MSENDAAIDHLRAARRHLREACIDVEDSRPRVAATLSRLVADVNVLVPVVDDAAAADSASVDGPQRILDALTDPDCRRILAATGGDARTVSELAEACAIPVSTVYRKIDRLADAGLLAEDLRVESPGPHAHEYRRTVDDVHVFLDRRPSGGTAGARSDGGRVVTDAGRGSPADRPNVVPVPRDSRPADDLADDRRRLLSRDGTAVALLGDADTDDGE